MDSNETASGFSAVPLDILVMPKGENKMLKIELTEAQIELLEPLFQAVRDANKAGSVASIGAQIWPDGMVVKLFDQDKGAALSSALGGNYNRQHFSADHRMDTDAVDA